MKEILASLVLVIMATVSSAQVRSGQAAADVTGTLRSSKAATNDMSPATPSTAPSIGNVAPSDVAPRGITAPATLSEAQCANLRRHAETVAALKDTPEFRDCTRKKGNESNKGVTSSDANARAAKQNDLDKTNRIDDVPAAKK